MKGMIIALISAMLIAVPVKAQTPAAILEIIKAGIVKVIKAVDLKIQRLQNETIWLQNAQKTIENTFSKLKLEEIAQWSEKQRELYANYFDELYRVKNIIVFYQRIKDVTMLQVSLIREYKRAYALFKNDKHFTDDEIRSMEKVYAAIVDESIKNLDQIQLMLTAYSTQISDEKRLEIIEAASGRIEQNYKQLLSFNEQNSLISIERARSFEEINVLTKYHGID